MKFASGVFVLVCIALCSALPLENAVDNGVVKAVEEPKVAEPVKDDVVRMIFIEEPSVNRLVEESEQSDEQNDEQNDQPISAEAEELPEGLEAAIEGEQINAEGANRNKRLAVGGIGIGLIGGVGGFGGGYPGKTKKKNSLRIKK